MKQKIFLLLSIILLVIEANAQNALSNNDDEQMNNRSYLIKYFNDASKEFNIPIEILEGIAFIESHWVQIIPTNNGENNMPPAYGIMGLRNDEWFGYSLNDAAKLIHVIPEKLKTDVQANIRGASALLKKYADEEISKTGKKLNKLEDWKNILEKYSGIPQSKVSQLYSRDIFYIISKGYDKFGIKINKVKIDTLLLKDPLLNENIIKNSNSTTSLACAGASWVPAASGNYAASNRPSTFVINKIIIHVTEGSFSSSVSWFQNPSSGVSSHYIVSDNGSTIYQMVDEKDIAYHAGNLQYNDNSIGIEVTGYSNTDGSWFSPAILTEIANICICECNYWGIAKNRVNIIGHNQVPDPNNGTLWGGASHHSDPGGYFSWDYLMPLIGTASSYQQLKINTTTLNVRTIPGTSTLGPALTTVAQDQEFVSYYQDTSSGWYLIFIPGDNSLHYDGWISNSYVTPVSCQNQIKVAGAWSTPLNIRTGPSTSYSLIDKCIDDQIFVAFNVSAGWYQFYTPASSTVNSGWCSGTYLSFPCGAPSIIQEITDIKKFFVYPNPADDLLNVIGKEIQNDNYQIALINSLGQTLIEKEIKVENKSIEVQLYIKELSSGMYFLIINSSKINKVFKIQKQ